MPGQPPGNVEYSLCKPCLLRLGSIGQPRRKTNNCHRKRNPKARNLVVTLSKYSPVQGVRFSQMDDATAHRDGHGLRSVAGPQLLHNVLDMDLDRLF